MHTDLLDRLKKLESLGVRPAGEAIAAIGALDAELRELRERLVDSRAEALAAANVALHDRLREIAEVLDLAKWGNMDENVDRDGTLTRASALVAEARAAGPNALGATIVAAARRTQALEMQVAHLADAANAQLGLKAFLAVHGIQMRAENRSTTTGRLTVNLEFTAIGDAADVLLRLVKSLAEDVERRRATVVA